jgi:hypothetical protein
VNSIKYNFVESYPFGFEPHPLIQVEKSAKSLAINNQKILWESFEDGFNGECIACSVCIEETTYLNFVNYQISPNFTIIEADLKDHNSAVVSKVLELLELTEEDIIRFNSSIYSDDDYMDELKHEFHLLRTWAQPE